jgi:hypothetical protein
MIEPIMSFDSFRFDQHSLTIACNGSPKNLIKDLKRVAKYHGLRWDLE